MPNPKATSRPFGAIAGFLILAYGLDWVIQVPVALNSCGILHVNVPHKLQIVAQIAPAVAALIATGWFHGRGAVKTLVASILRVRVSFLWYVLVLLAPPATLAIAVLIYRMTGRPIPALDPWYEIPLLIILSAPLCLGEELGWRSFLLKRLVRSNSLLTATAWVAFWWGLWHLPLYLGQGQGLTYLIFIMGMFPVSAFFTFIYLRTGSVFLCVLLHASMDVGANYWLAPMPAGGFFLAFGLWIAVLWLAAIPVFFALANSTGPGVFAETE